MFVDVETSGGDFEGVITMAMLVRGFEGCVRPKADAEGNLTFQIHLSFRRHGKDSLRKPFLWWSRLHRCRSYGRRSWLAQWFAIRSNLWLSQGIRIAVIFLTKLNVNNLVKTDGNPNNNFWDGQIPSKVLHIFNDTPPKEPLQYTSDLAQQRGWRIFACLRQ